MFNWNIYEKNWYSMFNGNTYEKNWYSMFNWNIYEKNWYSKTCSMGTYMRKTGTVKHIQWEHI